MMKNNLIKDPAQLIKPNVQKKKGCYSISTYIL